VAGLKVLVVNAGSTSLKLAVVEDARRVVAASEHPPLHGDDLSAALSDLLAGAGEPDAAGHRLVHGGTRLSAPVRVTREVSLELEQASELAPLHNPPALRAIGEVRRLRPELPSVACFDTGFHSTMPAEAAAYALPASWSDRWPLRRYGFHGLSHSWAARRARELLGAERARRLVSCHLGAGASLAAIADGRSIDTTMGFTPLEGLVMATRPGSLDPGLLLWVQRHGEIGVAEAEQALDREAGLLGLSRRSADMREVIAAADAGDEACALAFEVYVHRLRAGIAAMAASLRGIDAVSFTAGVGERSARVRAAAVEGLGFLGAEIDLDTNDMATPDAVISPPETPVASLLLRSREDLEIARGVGEVMAAEAPAAG
jgi:acetate kinase